MTQSLALLERPHAEVIRELVSDELVSGVEMEDVLLGVPTFGPDLGASLPLYINSDAYDKPNWPYFGSAAMTYTRVDLYDALGHLGLNFRLSTDSVTTNWIIQQLSDILLLHFDSEDIIHESIPVAPGTHTYVMRAAPNSPRWTGSVSVVLRR